MSFQNFRFEVDADGIALVTFDMPGKSMNVLSRAAVEEMAGVVEKIASDAAVKGAVITSGKDAFCAGADVTEFGAMFEGSEAEIKANGFSQTWCRAEYKKSIDTYGARGVPKSRLILTEHFANTAAGMAELLK